MTITSPLVTFGLFALTIKNDATLSCDDKQSFSNTNDLKTGITNKNPFISFEPNYWLLDGKYKFGLVSNVHVGLVSQSMSDENGNFAVPPVLTIEFSQVHTTTGFTLRFAEHSNDYAAGLQVQAYNEADELIYEEGLNPTSWEFFIEHELVNFKKIVVTFYATNKPYRYLRVSGIDFGTLIHFTGADIKSAIVTEQINPLSIEVPISTLELSLHSEDQEFSIINPTGFYSQLKNRQPFDVYENVDDDKVYIGQFYLDKWENPSETEIKFSCVDNIGILNSFPYLGGLWSTPYTVSNLLQTMMAAVSMPYELDTALEALTIQGWIPVCTYREALQQIAFAIGGYVTCSRTGVITITKAEIASELTEYDYAITAAEKGSKQSLTLRPLVTGVEVSSHKFVPNSTSTELYNDTLTVGQHTITFSSPQHDLSISGGTILESGANYAIVDVSVEDTVILLGQGYVDTTKVYGVYNEVIDPTVRRNVLEIDSATLVYPSIAMATAQRVYDYYQQRYLQKVKLYAPQAATKDSVLIDTLSGRQLGGIVEKMTLDLAMGFTAETEIVGVVVEE